MSLKHLFDFLLSVKREPKKHAFQHAAYEKLPLPDLIEFEHSEAA